VRFQNNFRLLPWKSCLTWSASFVDCPFAACPPISVGLDPPMVKLHDLLCTGDARSKRTPPASSRLCATEPYYVCGLTWWWNHTSGNPVLYYKFFSVCFLRLSVVALRSRTFGSHRRRTAMYQSCDERLRTCN
jgi:hypothetical protein